MLLRIVARSIVVRAVKGLSGQVSIASSRSSGEKVEMIARPADVESAGSRRPITVAAK